MNLAEIRQRAEAQPGGMVTLTKAEYGYLLDRIENGVLEQRLKLLDQICDLRQVVIKGRGGEWRLILVATHDVAFYQEKADSLGELIEGFLKQKNEEQEEDHGIDSGR